MKDEFLVFEKPPTYESKVLLWNSFEIMILEFFWFSPLLIQKKKDYLNNKHNSIVVKLLYSFLTLCVYKKYQFKKYISRN